MKKILIIAAIIVGLISYSCVNRQQTTDNSHSHQHSESCSHNHDHDHNHDHSTHSHEHSATCDHDHDHDHNHDHSTHNHDHSAHSHDHNHEGGITFGIDQQSKIDFEVVEVVSEPLYQIIRTSAQILPSQESEKILTATTNGIVSFENKDIVEGLEVKSGQTLFR